MTTQTTVPQQPSPSPLLAAATPATPATPATSAMAMSTTPVWVSRVNLFPYRDIVAPDQSARDDAAVATVLREAARRGGLRDAAMAELTSLVEADRSRASRDWLPLRRAVQSGRAPKSRLLELGTNGSGSGLGEATIAWLSSWVRTDRALEQLTGDHEVALEAEREVLTDWSRDDDVQQSTVMTSPSLYRAVASRSEVAGALTKRQRKSEQSLVTYFNRSTTKVSPFSRYTGTAFHHLDSRAGSLGEGHLSVVSLRRLLVRRAARLLCTDPDVRPLVNWRLSDAVRDEGDRLTIHRRSYVTPKGAKSDVVSEDQVSFDLSGSWRSVWDALVAVASPSDGAGLSDLEGHLSATFGWSAEQSAAILDALISVQTLVPVVDIPEQAEDFVEQWASLAATLPGDRARALENALRVSRHAECALPTMTPSARADLVEATQAAWQEVLGEPVDNPLVEDCYVVTDAPAPGRQVDTWAAQLHELAPLLVAMDDQRVLVAALEATFVRHFGVGGVCRDLRSFARQSYATFPLTQELLAGQVSAEVEHIVGSLRRARQVISSHLVDLARSGEEEAQFDASILGHVASLLPEREWEAARSLTVFGQPADETFVVNHLYGGRGRYFSRFLAHQPASVVEQVRAGVAEAGAAGVRHLHLRPTLGFNANVGPLLAPEELGLTDEATSTHAPLSIDDLVLSHDPTTGLSLTVAATQEPVEVLYTGFLVPHALPSEDMLLAMLAGAPYFSFNELTLDLHARLTEGGGAPVAASRIRHRDLVLFRRRFGVSAADLLPGVAGATGSPGTNGSTSTTGPASEAERFADIATARMSSGLPIQSFVRPLFGRQISPMERAMSARPQFVDLGSRLNVAGLARRIQPLGETLLMEEFSPDPRIHGVDSRRGRHATEIFFEVSLSPGVRS